jgi:hypothetical protein
MHEMFELRVYVGANEPIISYHVSGLVPLNNLAKNAAAEGGFNYTRAECWWRGVRQWELLID